MTKQERILSILAGIIVLVCYAFASLYCHPSGDDFTYAVKAQSGAFLKTVLNERYDTNGRYISNFLMLFSPLNWGGLAAYKFMPMLIIALMFSGTLVFYRLIIQKHSIILTFVSMLIGFSIMPDITEAVYWYTGAWTYTPSAILFLIAAAIIIRNQSLLKPTHHILAIILFAIACGFNETIALYGMAGAIFFAIKSRFNRISLVYSALFTILLAYVINAPGNTVRSSLFEDSHQVFYSIGMSSIYSARFIGEWLINPAFLLWAIVLLKFQNNDAIDSRLQFLRHPLTVIAILLLPVFISCFGPFWSTGMLGQYRTANLASILFVPSFTMVILANKAFIARKIKSTRLQQIAFPLLLVFLLSWKNQFYLFEELITSEIAQFDEEMNERYDLIQACENDVCLIPEIEHQPKTLFVYALNDDPEHWWNKSYQMYFNSGQIIKSSGMK